MPKVTNPNQYPYSPIGLLLFTLENGDQYWGTGALIDQKHVLTAGHNIFYGGLPATSAIFYPAYSSRSEPGGGGMEVDRGFIKKAFKEKERAWDIGIYRLKKEHKLPQYLKPEIVREYGQPDPEMLIAGYPGNHHFEMWEDEQYVTNFDVNLHVFSYTHDTAAGSSGSPVFQKRRSGDAPIYGVHGGLPQNTPEDKVGVLVTEVTDGFIQAALHWGQADDFVVVIE